MNALQKLFNSKEAKKLTAERYPYLNGHRVEVKECNDRYIVERHIINSNEYSYIELTKHDADKIAAIEYDPFDDAGYARKLLDKVSDILVPEDY